MKSDGYVAMWQKFWTDERGATSIEYGLIASLIVVALIGGMTQLGSTMEVVYGDVKDDLE